MRLYNGVILCDRPAPANIERIDRAICPMVVEMMDRGIKLDLAHFSRLSKKIAERIEYVHSDIELLIGKRINWNSQPAVSRLLFHELHIQRDVLVPLTKTGEFTTAEDTLVLFRDAHPVVDLILEGRELDKLRGTYVDKFPFMVDGGERIHTTLKMQTTSTGRMASEDPNLQNIPVLTELGNQVRYGFIPEPGHVLASLDFSQIEMIWTAHLSRDPFMCDVFRVPGPDGKPRDIHVEGAARLFRIPIDQVDKRKHRLPSKSLNFGIVYGILAPSLQVQILAAGGPLIPLEELTVMIADWFGVYPGVRRFMDSTYDRVRRWGMVWTAFGRVRLIPQTGSAIPRIVRRGLREAGNHPVQGSAGDHIKIAMAEIWDRLVIPLQQMGETVWPLLQIHDELIFELSPSIAADFCGMARDIMEKSVPLEVPVRSSADFGERSWGELKN